MVEKVYKPKKSFSVYEYKLKGSKDKFKEEELFKVDGIPQNKILKLNKFVISKFMKLLIRIMWLLWSNMERL